MAGLATGPLFKPPQSRLRFKPPPPAPPPQLSLSAFESPLFSLSLCSSASKSTFSLSSSSHLRPITARFGGYRSDEDQALDLSSIRSDKVRLIDEEQKMVGVVSKSEAIQRAEDAELDLVILSPDADPPVVRIMNYDKYRYEQQKKKREQQKKSAANRMDLKELKMGCNIDVHDYSVRLRAAQKFLKDGDKVKVIVNLKGRGNVLLDKAIELIRRFQNDVGELAVEESNNFSRYRKNNRSSFTERYVSVVLLPNKLVLQKGQETPSKKSKSTANEVSAGV